MKRTHVMIGLASLVGAALVAGSALAVPAVFSPTGHLNVRSGPGFQYGVVAQMPANTRFPVTGCIQDYSWCSVVVGNVTGWASLPAAVPVYPIPASPYVYSYVNGQRVVVEPAARRIVYVVR